MISGLHESDCLIQQKMPNLYGNPEMQIDDLMDDIYSKAFLTTLINNESSGDNNTQLNTATLNRISSLKGRRDPLTPPKLYTRPPPIHQKRQQLYGRSYY